MLNVKLNTEFDTESVLGKCQLHHNFYSHFALAVAFHKVIIPFPRLTSSFERTQ